MAESASELGFAPRRSKRIRNNRNSSPISRDQPTATTEASKFMSIIATDELLDEILLRIPDARTVVRCSTVCKRWSSLISRQFIRRYIHHHHRHNRAPDPPCTLLIHSIMVEGEKHPCPFYKLFSEESKILHGIDSVERRDYLGFLPWTSVWIKASFDDLLLVSRLSNSLTSDAYCVCNPVTKQWLFLPETNLRPWYYERCGLVCKKQTDRCIFKAVILSHYSLNKPVFETTVFCSETGQWSQESLVTPRELTLDSHFIENAVFTVNEIVHFPVYNDSSELRGMVALNPFESENSHEGTGTGGQGQCRFIEVPADFESGWRARKYKLCLGMVWGRLRLLRFLKASGALLEIKVWELSYNNNNNGHEYSWDLVHDVSLKRDVRKKMMVLALDPNDGDSIFVLRNYSVLKYKINGSEEECEKVGQIPNVKLSNNVKDKLGWYLNVSTLVHPPWPTPIPTLPSL